MNSSYEKLDSPILLPKRKRDGSKQNYGSLLIVAGCVGLTGAPSLASRAAVRGGAGRVYLGVPRHIYDVTAVKNDEAMPFPLPCDDRGKLSMLALPELMPRLRRSSCLAIGPGLGRSFAISRLVPALVAASTVPTVVDADGLWAISKQLEVIKASPRQVVLTPHEGEFLTLGGVLSGDRVADAHRFSRKWGCTLVLKGRETVVAFPDGVIYVNQTGNPGMARGGSGDVLTGLMGAMLCQLPFREAVIAAVYLHGFAGDICAMEKGEYGMTPMDMIETLPAAMKYITEE